MINRIILAAIIAIGSACAAQAAGAADWQTFPGQCNFLAEPKVENRPLTGALPVFDSALYVRVHLDEKGAPHIALWTDVGFLDGKPIFLQPGSLLISVDGRAFTPLHTASVANGSIVASELPHEILAAMHDGQTVRIEYQEDGTPGTPLVREVPLKGFAGMVDACGTLERRYDEQEARATPDTKADVTLLCGDKTVQAWFAAGMLTWDTAAHRQVWRLDRVGAAEITFKRLGVYDTAATPGFMQDGPSFADLDGQIDRVSGAFSRSDGSRGTCAPATAKF